MNHCEFMPLTEDEALASIIERMLIKDTGTGSVQLNRDKAHAIKTFYENIDMFREWEIVR